MRCIATSVSGVHLMTHNMFSARTQWDVKNEFEKISAMSYCTKQQTQLWMSGGGIMWDFIKSSSFLNIIYMCVCILLQNVLAKTQTIRFHIAS